MKLHKEEVARCGALCVSAQEYSCAVRAWIVFVKKIMNYDLRSRHVFSLPGAVVHFLSQSPHLHARGELEPLAQSSIIPSSTSLFDFRLSRELSLML